jgi:hypothetical protein
MCRIVTCHLTISAHIRPEPAPRNLHYTTSTLSRRTYPSFGSTSSRLTVPLKPACSSHAPVLLHTPQFLPHHLARSSTGRTNRIILTMSVSIAEVQVEHHESGFGISHTAPRLSWRFGPSTVKDWTQASYEVVVTRNGKDEQYKVDSAESVLVPWPSKPLSSRESATVKVRAIGKDGTSTDWKEAKLELGLLEEEQWKGDLISCPRRQVDEPKRPFRVWKEFKVDKAGRAR